MIKTGLIGFGLSGKVFHFPYLNGLPDYSLDKIYTSRDHDLLKSSPGITTTTEIDSIIEDKDLDLIVITSPNTSHFELAKRSLENGKHVLLEKPFVLEVGHAKELFELARTQNKVLEVFQNRRFDGDFLTVKEVIEKKVLGEIVYFESHFDRFRPSKSGKWREQLGPGSGTLWDLGPHLIDQAFDLFGIPSDYTGEAFSQRDQVETDDFFHLYLKYPNGLRVSLNSSCLAKDFYPRFLIHGTKGSLRITGMDNQEANLKLGMDIFDEKLSFNKTQAIELSTETGESKTELKKGEYLTFFKNLSKKISSPSFDPKNEELLAKQIEMILKISSNEMFQN